MRTAGALLTIAGVVGLIDAVMTGFGGWPLAAALLGSGALCFALGRRWSR